MGRVVVGVAAGVFALVVLLGATAGGVVAAILGTGTTPGCVTGSVCDGGDGATGAGVSLPPGYALPASTPPAIVAAIAWALAQRGTPYAYGGDCTAPHSGDPAHECDCSSLVQAAYRAGSVSLPRTTREQVHAGTPVASLADLRPGDLIFIPGSDGTMANPGHVGLAIGSGLLVQAPHTGDVVKISRVFGTSGWADQVTAIRRIVPG